MRGKKKVPLESKKEINFSLTDILFPFLLPIKGVARIGEKVKEVAEMEFTDRSKVQEELLNLQMLFDMDEISEEEFKKKEEKLLDKLETIRKYEEEREG
jgi:hypothetical protein